METTSDINKQSVNLSQLQTIVATSTYVKPKKIKKSEIKKPKIKKITEKEKEEISNVNLVENIKNKLMHNIKNILKHSINKFDIHIYNKKIHTSDQFTINTYTKNCRGFIAICINKNMKYDANNANNLNDLLIRDTFIKEFYVKRVFDFNFCEMMNLNPFTKKLGFRYYIAYDKLIKLSEVNETAKVMLMVYNEICLNAFSERTINWITTDLIKQAESKQFKYSYYKKDASYYIGYLLYNKIFNDIKIKQDYFDDNKMNFLW
ncbi:MAG: hypothetical protein Terrestrivirus1_127 [Terrestrivirus sp.]|uniref:Uncharacterized protein n=1 Tax=Terrestrivirus sp. TaxID=2487775 RepID=A0A3G4ZNS0_9VIRU|nr:MAG: hypothetical protein Terrestrivirus1_127 [Terrestrivirus sp.]